MSGDWLSKLALTYLGDANRWPEIYDAKKSVIENAAKDHPGPPVYGTSDHGHWIFPGTSLTLPGTCQQPSAPTGAQPYKADCSKDSFLIAARGSGENPPDALYLGKKGEKSALSVLYDGLNGPGESVGVFGSKYLAEDAVTFFLKSRRVKGQPIWAHKTLSPSAEDGARELLEVLEAQAKCKDGKQKIVLAGYSQGGAVIRELLQLASPELRDRISGIALFGDARAFGTEVPSDLQDKTVPFCAEGDPVCRVAPQSWASCKALAADCPHFHYAVKPDGGLSDAEQAAYFLKYGRTPVNLGKPPGTTPAGGAPRLTRD